MTVPASLSLDAERDCRDLVHAFAWHVDHREYESVVALFTTDCVIERPGARFDGHSGLRKMLDARPTDIQTLHVFSNMRLNAVSPDSAAGRYYFTLYSAPGSFDPESAPLSQNGPTMTGAIHDLFTRTKRGWLIASRQARIVFS